MTEEHDEWSELVVGRALDALEPGDDARLTTHLVTCTDCRALLVEMRQVAAAMAYDVADAEPPAALLDRIRESLPAVSAAAVPVLAARRASRTARAASARVLLAAAAVVVFVVIVGGGFVVAHTDHERSTARSALAAQSAVMADLEHGSSYTLRSGSPAAGTAVVSGRDVDLIADGLDRNNPGTTYVLWAASGPDTRMVALRVFDVTSGGTTLVRATLPASLSSATVFGVTEQKGGTLPAAPGTVILGSSTGA